MTDSNPATANTAEPNLRALRIGIIGAGRLGTALAWALARRDLHIVAASSRTTERARHLAAAIAGCRVAESAQAVVDACDVVFICTPDGAIEALTQSLRWRQGMGVVHCSAATEINVLAKAQQDGAAIGGFHPLQTFSDPETAVRSLPGCTITIEAAAPFDATLEALATRLQCRINRLPPGARGLYHAVGGYASQFINVLLREASIGWQSWGATEEDAVRALLPLVRGTLAAIERSGLAHGMPGPVSRGDVGTIAKHVAALSAFDAQALDFYREMCRRTIPLALERKGIDADTARRIAEVLERQ